MNRAAVFCSRNLREMLRDPLSYIFCLAFPLVMLLIMTLINSSIPPKAGVTVFRIENLCGGVAVFGQTFVMLFTALSISKDRAGSFLVRMYATPMTSSDFVLGYIMPMLIIAVIQGVITYAASFIVSIIVGTPLDIVGMLAALITLIPSAVFFTSVGMLFGTLFNDKAAPGLCSIIISLGSFLGSVFFDAESTGGVMLTICKCAPFFYCTKSVRAATSLDFSFESYLLPLAVVTASAAAVTALSIFCFSRRMRADLS